MGRGRGWVKESLLKEGGIRVGYFSQNILYMLCYHVNVVWLFYFYMGICIYVIGDMNILC